MADQSNGKNYVIVAKNENGIFIAPNDLNNKIKLVETIYVPQIAISTLKNGVRKHVGKLGGEVDFDIVSKDFSKYMTGVSDSRRREVADVLLALAVKSDKSLSLTPERKISYFPSLEEFQEVYGRSLEVDYGSQTHIPTDHAYRILTNGDTKEQGKILRELIKMSKELEMRKGQEDFEPRKTSFEIKSSMKNPIIIEEERDTVTLRLDTESRSYALKLKHDFSGLSDVEDLGHEAEPFTNDIYLQNPLYNDQIYLTYLQPIVTEGVITEKIPQRREIQRTYREDTLGAPAVKISEPKRKLGEDIPIQWRIEKRGHPGKGGGPQMIIKLDKELKKDANIIATELRNYVPRHVEPFGQDIVVKGWEEPRNINNSLKEILRKRKDSKSSNQ